MQKDSKMKCRCSSAEKASSSSSAEKPSSSAEKAPSSSSAKAPSFKTITQCNTPYSITDIIASYNLSPSDYDDQLETLQLTDYLKDLELKPDHDIVTILKRSKTLTQHTPSVTARGRELTFSGDTAVLGNLIYQQGGSVINLSNRVGHYSPIPRNTDLIQNMTTDGALFILLVSDISILMILAFELFPKRFPCIVITTEGSPDFLIRMESELNLHVLALFGSDPDSLEMLAFYGRTLKNLNWLGIRPTDIILGKVLVQHRIVLLSREDIKTVDLLLKDAYVVNRPKWLDELHTMLKHNQKFHVESLSCYGVVEYMTHVLLPMKLQHEDWI